jgi:hypothetical protein
LREKDGFGEPTQAGAYGRGAQFHAGQADRRDLPFGGMLLAAGRAPEVDRQQPQSSSNERPRSK